MRKPAANLAEPLVASRNPEVLNSLVVIPHERKTGGSSLHKLVKGLWRHLLALFKNLAYDRWRSVKLEVSNHFTLEL
jgi:hypothetical protein